MTDLSDAEVLEKGAKILSADGAWTQRTFARDALGNAYEGYGEQGDIRDFGAQCFCVFGALAMAEGAKDPEEARRGHKALMRHLDLPFVARIADWNDAACRTQAEVVAALRSAAALARAAS